MPAPIDGKQTFVQKLSDLVAWFLGDQDVELRFVPNAQRKGKYAPEFDFQYWINDRQISERGLAMLINARLSQMNYNYIFSKVVVALVEHSWRHYIANCEYPYWLRTPTPKLKRPPGRPRKRPLKIKVPAYPPGSDPTLSNP